jgi:hypothetical protein
MRFRQATRLFALVLLLVTAHRLPAPILEEEKPAATPAKPKAIKHQEPSASSDTSHKSGRGFDGTWTGGSSVKDTGASGTLKFTLVIKGKSAENTQDYTVTLAATQPSWTGNLEPYNTVRSLYRKWSWSSTDLTVDGSNLRIRWPAARLVDWSPKTIPLNIIQSVSNQPAKVSVYTLKGDQLTRDFDSQGGITYNRAR